MLEILLEETIVDQQPLLDHARLNRLQPESVLRGRNVTKADVLRYRVGETSVAVKSYAARPLVVRWLLGRWLTAREAVAYRAAAGIAGVPRFLGRLGPYALATEWIEAVPLSSLRGQRLDAGLFDELGRILDELHARGVAHGDLHHRDVLVTAAGAVYLVDLATAVCLGERPGYARSWLFARLRASDRLALERQRSRFCGAQEQEWQAAADPRAVVWHRRARRLKGAFDRLRGRVR